MSNLMKIGTILRRCWGYDQTNVDFFVVVRRTKTTVVFQSIEKTIVENGGSYDLVAPLLRDGQPVVASDALNRRKVIYHNGEEFLSWAKYSGAGVVKVWSGKPEHETAFGCGP